MRKLPSLPHLFTVGTKVCMKISENCTRFGEVVDLDKRLSDKETCHTLRYFRVQVKWTHCVINGMTLPREIVSWVRTNNMNPIEG